MKRVISLEFVAGILALTFAASSVAMLFAQVNCNALTPTLGNCGQEDTCEMRTSSGKSICEATYGRYYEDEAGIGCQGGSIDSYCAQLPDQPGNYMKCTCEFFCEWNDLFDECRKGDPHLDAQGNQICSIQLKYDSDTCIVPP